MTPGQWREIILLSPYPFSVGYPFAALHELFVVISENMVKMATDPEPRNRVLYETDPKFGNDKAQKPDDIPNESFRRLNVE